MTKGKSSSVQSTKTTERDLLRTLLIPTVIAIKKYAQQRRPEDSQGVRPERLIYQPLRSIIIGPRPIQRPIQSNIKRLHTYKNMFGRTEDKNKGYVTVCQKREDRRESLFALGVAGHGRRRSPGQGGSYRRTQDSNIVCKKVRR